MHAKFGSFAICCILINFCLEGPIKIDVMAQTPNERGEGMFRDAATHADLSLVYEQACENDPLKLLGQDPEILAIAKAYTQESLIDRSEILSYGGVMTIVPKGSVILVPEQLRDRVRAAEEAKVVSWPDFLRQNSIWILPMKVKFEQATGEEMLDKNLLAQLEKSGKIVVATCNDHPISIFNSALKTTQEILKDE